MKTSIAKVTLFSLIAAALVAVPAITRADDTSTNAPAAAPVKKHGAPFHGKIAAVDTAAMSITVGEMTIDVTSETKIMKNGQPATLSDLTVGDMAGGYYKKDDAGKMTATTLRVGAKMKKPKSDMTNTNN
jgi:hypothetical protein